MPAILQEVFDNGGSDNNPLLNSVTDTLGPPRLKFKTADDPTVDFINPIPKPVSGIKYSYWKQIYLKCSEAPNTQCDNFKWYTDAIGFGTGVSFKIGTQTPIRNAGSKAGYDLATGVIGESGDVMTNHSDVSASSDAFAFTLGSPKNVSCSEPGNIINAIGETTNYIVLQVEVINTATVGTPTNTILTWKWDEI
jgi:hypothetical protein